MALKSKYVLLIVVNMFMSSYADAQERSKLMQTVLHIYDSVPCAITERDMSCTAEYPNIGENIHVMPYDPARSPYRFDRVDLSFLDCLNIDSQMIDNNGFLLNPNTNVTNPAILQNQTLLISPRYFCNSRSIIIAEFRESSYVKWRTFFYCENEKIILIKNITLLD